MWDELPPGRAGGAPATRSGRRLACYGIVGRKEFWVKSVCDRRQAKGWVEILVVSTECHHGIVHGETLYLMNNLGAVCVSTCFALRYSSITPTCNHAGPSYSIRLAQLSAPPPLRYSGAVAKRVAPTWLYQAESTLEFCSVSSATCSLRDGI